jgi:undecaprenol kinase
VDDQHDKPPVSDPLLPAKPPYTFASSVRFAWQGLRAAWKEARNIPIQVTVAAVVLVAAALLQTPPIEWCFVVLCFAGLIASEIANTAVEDAVDMTSPDIHPLAKSAKDMAAAVVLFMDVVCIVVCVAVLLPLILKMLGE